MNHHRRVEVVVVVGIGSTLAGIELGASVGAPGPHDLMSSRFFGLLKTSEAPENKGIFLFLLDEQMARRNPLGPDRP